MSGFEKRPYRELVADSQESRDRYFAALREWYRAQSEPVKRAVRAPIFLVQPEELEATPQPPEPPLSAFREIEPVPPAIETIPQSESIPEPEEVSVARPVAAGVRTSWRTPGVEWQISDRIDRKSQRIALMIAETAHQRNLADIADQRFRQWARTRDFGYDGATEEL